MKSPDRAFHFVAIVFAAAMCAAAPSWAASSLTCLTGSDPSVAGDAAQITAARQSICAACPCSSFDGSEGKTRSSYKKCVAAAIEALGLGSLREKCIATVKKLYGKSTCGAKPELHAHPCIKRKTATGKLGCTIKSSTKKDGVTPVDACHGSATTTAVTCPAFSHCMDAADSNGDLLLNAGDNGSCGAQLPANIPAGFPPAELPPAGSPVPPVPPSSSSYCDYNYCYSNTAGSWSALPRLSSPPAPPNVPPNSLPVPDPETPFAPYDYCDLSYCYKQESSSNTWSGNLRYGSELLAPVPSTSTSYCGLNYCYSAPSLVWLPAAIDPEAMGLPPPVIAPESVPGPPNVSPSAPTSYCESNYCYAKNHYGVWFTEYAP